MESWGIMSWDSSGHHYSLYRNHSLFFGHYLVCLHHQSTVVNHPTRFATDSFHLRQQLFLRNPFQKMLQSTQNQNQQALEHFLSQSQITAAGESFLTLAEKQCNYSPCASHSLHYQSTEMSPVHAAPHISQRTFSTHIHAYSVKCFMHFIIIWLKCFYCIYLTIINFASCCLKRTIQSCTWLLFRP